MTTNDARRAVKAALIKCEGKPRNQRLQDVFDALDKEIQDGTPPAPLDIHDFDVSFMDDYFQNPFTQAQAFAEAIYVAAGSPAGVAKPPAPSLDHMTAFYTLYVVDGGVIV